MTRRRPSAGTALRWTGAATLGALMLSSTTALAAPTEDPTPRVSAALASSVISPQDWPHPTPPSDDESEEYGNEAVRLRTATINDRALTRICGPAELGTEARFPLFEDTVVEAAEVSRETIDGVLTWHGEVEGTTDQEVIVNLRGGCDGKPGNEELSAHFMLGGAIYDIVPDGPGRVRVMEATPETDEDDRDVVPPKSRPIDPPSAKAHGPEARAPKAACKGGDKISVIDILVGYSPKARTEAGGDTQIKAQIAKAISLTNDALATSGILARVRLVHSAYINISATYDTQSSAALLAFAKKGDGVADTLPTLRDQYGADQVTMITGGSAMGGIAYTPETPGPTWKEWAYSIVAQNAIAHYSFGHELGHNLSANHDWVTEPSQPNNGAAGYFPKKGDWSTLMAYESSCRTATKGTCGRINRFSNYNQSYRGEKLGTKPTASHAADSSVIFNTSSEAVAAYRTAKTDSSWCDVTPSSSPSVSAGRIVPKLMGPFAQNATASFTATPAKGYVFSYWTLDGKRQSSTSKTISVAMNSKDHTLKATFKKGASSTSTVSTSSSGSGSVKSSSKSSARALAGAPVLEGDELHYTAVPKAGWHFAGWMLDGSYAGDDNDIYLRVGEDDSALTAVFEPADLTLTKEVQGGEGTISVFGGDGPYADGDTVHVVAKPAKGYRFVDWLLDGEPYGGDEEQNQACTAIHFDESGHTVTAVFAPK
ncbi:zinc-dependent metalloprotease family protein [Streptomyces sp. NPDC046909]|uniref:InlB B-repeat-containing protein n=1 Tax=Streptomyces sp. NPDC046909 TaxID=3155617 RepID=UPI0033F343EA